MQHIPHAFQESRLCFLESLSRRRNSLWALQEHSYIPGITQNYLRILHKLPRNPCHACLEDLVEQEQNLKYLSIKVVVQQICFPTQILAWKMFNTSFFPTLPPCHSYVLYYFFSLFFPLDQADTIFFFLPFPGFIIAHVASERPYHFLTHSQSDQVRPSFRQIFRGGLYISSLNLKTSAKIM